MNCPDEQVISLTFSELSKLALFVCLVFFFFLVPVSLNLCAFRNNLDGSCTNAATLFYVFVVRETNSPLGYEVFQNRLGMDDLDFSMFFMNDENTHETTLATSKHRCCSTHTTTTNFKFNTEKQIKLSLSFFSYMFGYE